jgi:hypothetical protein
VSCAVLEFQAGNAQHDVEARGGPPEGGRFGEIRTHASPFLK